MIDYDNEIKFCIYDTCKDVKKFLWKFDKHLDEEMCDVTIFKLFGSKLIIYTFNLYDTKTPTKTLYVYGLSYTEIKSIVGKFKNITQDDTSK